MTFHTAERAGARGRLATLLYRLSLALSLAAAGWVGWMLWRGPGFGGSGPAGAPLLRAVALAAAAYSALTALLAVAWWWLLGAYERRPPLRAACAVWARAQIAKYLPGNVLHYASRQVLGRALGLGHASLVASAVLELVGTVLAALLISLHASLVAGLDAGAVLPLPWLIAGAALLVPGWPALDRLLRRWRPTAAWLEPLPRMSPARSLVLLGPALLLHALFLLGTGALLLGLMRTGWPLAAAPPLLVVESYALAWLAGTLMPGAPGGLGVREAVLVLLLGPSLGAAEASALAVALRAATLAGDLLTAGAGWALGARPTGPIGPD